MDVVIVCHTEFGYVNEKEVIFDKNHPEGVFDGVKNLVKLTDKYNAKVTFAVAPEAATVFPKITGHEIGIHVHPGWEEFKQGNISWFVGDQYLRKHCSIKKTSTALNDYNYQEQSELISKSKERIKEVLGVDSKVFVAGRWSLNHDTIKVLADLGITHECSALSGRKLTQVDWSKIPRLQTPYSPDKDDYQKQGSLPLTIVPVAQTWLAGEVNPERATVYGLPWMKACFTEYYQGKAPVFHIALHSPCMTNNYFITLLDNFLSFISNHPDIKFAFASQINASNTTVTQSSIIPYIGAVNITILRSIFKKIQNKLI